MTIHELRRACEPAIRRVLHFYWRFARAATLGARAAVIDGEGRVLLVQHSYVSGWHLPGGGVEPGETFTDALARELREEANIEMTGTPALHGLYFNTRVSKRDHVALYVVREFRQTATPKPNFEITGCGFFRRDELPADTSAGTRARLAEIFDGAAVSEVW